MAEILLTVEMWIARVRGSRDDDRGASLVEYALLLALIAIVCFVAVDFLGGETKTFYSDAGNSLANP